jgi:hypothetical protein
VSFYDEVLRELLFAVGAALFLGNLIALLRRRRGVPAGARSTAAAGDTEEEEYLDHAPVGRTVLFLVIGFVVMAVSLAAIIAY